MCTDIGFISDVTDLGYCHTFNPDPERMLKVSKTGIINILIVNGECKILLLSDFMITIIYLENHLENTSRGIGPN